MKTLRRHAFRLSLALTAVAAVSSAAEAKQCIWNKAGFILKVQWYTPGTKIDFNSVSDEYYITSSPIQTDVFPLGQGRCIEGAGNVAVLSIEGRDIAIGSIGVAVGVVTGAAAAAVCAGTAGAGCGPAAAGAIAATAAASAGVSGLAAAAATPPGTFLVATPGTDYWLDVWGTIWSPQTGQGGRI